MDTGKSVEWLAQLATSLVFLIPGYAVVRFLHTTRESRIADRFELTIESLVYSIFIGGVWFYITPPGTMLRNLLEAHTFVLSALLHVGAVLIALSWLAGITLLTAVTMAFIHHYQIYWKILERIGLGRLNGFITTWEELSDLSKDRWVSVQASDGFTYIGIISAVTPHPHERSLILSRSSKYPITMQRPGASTACGAEHIWFSGNEIKSVGVFPKQN